MYFSTVLIVLLIVLDVFAYFLQKHHQEDDGDQKNTSPSLSSGQRYVHEEDNCERKCSSSSPSRDTQCRRFSLAEIKVATNDFDEGHVIGKGGFGKVYKGKIGLGEGIDVAIKRSRLDSSQGAAEFWAEIEMLSKFRHSHIVSLLGYCEESGKREMILVYEYLPNGSLEDHLHKRRAHGSNSSPLTWVQRLHICIGAARGLDYLHTGTSVKIRVIHRDVKSSNILLDENLAAKISDFGVSRTSPAYLSGTTTNVFTGQIIGTFGYLDAEYFSTHRLTRKSDVYAFGVVLLEVLCGRPALDFTLDEQQHSLSGWAKQCIREGNIGRIIDPRLRGQVPGNCLKEFGQIAYECLRACAKDRPTMTKVLARLEFVLAWTLRSRQSANDRKHIGRAILIEKAWSLFSIKAPTRMSSYTKKLGQSDDNKEKGVTVEQHAALVVETNEVVRRGQPSSSNKLRIQHNSETTLATPRYLKIFTFDNLRSATRNFRPSAMLGVSDGESVYKGWLDSSSLAPSISGVGIAVAIKISNTDNVQRLKEWQAEVNRGKFSHPNLVKLLGYCSEDRMLCLVYDYIPKRNLANLLHRHPLQWDTTMKIATGTAQGLAFLHTAENSPKNRTFNPSNVLLNEDFEPRLYFGSASLVRAHRALPISESDAVDSHYTPPEYIATGHLYVKSDVYGFGVVMLEMITGLRVLDPNRPSSQINLVDWARSSLSDIKKLRRVMDPRLEHVYPSKGAIKVGELILDCLDQNPNRRPSMKRVVAILEEISAIKMKMKRLKPNTRHTMNPQHKHI